MSLAPRYYTFWSINGPLQQSRLRRQMDDFRAAGLHGVVFHPRYYPGIPPYMSAEYLKEVADAILYAKETGLRFWMYDENGWPSGTGDGKVLAQFPDSAAVRLDLFPDAQPNTVATFHITADGELSATPTAATRTWHLAPRMVSGVDALEPEVLKHFLDIIHEGYRKGLPREAFDYIEAFFADEPEAGTIKEPQPTVGGAPWSRHMPDKLRKKFGADYASKLPLLFGRGPGYREFRIGYWELVTDMMADGFFVPYLEWCQRHGKQFIGHVKGEEHPLFQIPNVGSCHRIFRKLSMPGIDSLERFPALDFYPRQASSAARQFAEGRCMVECFGGAGWGAAPHDLERYLLWLGRNGLTDFVFHLSQYRLDSSAIQDWPPSEPLHLTWKEAFPEVLRRVSKELETNPSPRRDTLVVAPYRGMMAEYNPQEILHTNQHVATTYPDSPAGRMNTAFLAQLDALRQAGVSYDLIDERTLDEDGQRDGPRVKVGHMTYDALVIAKDAIVKDREKWNGVPSTGPRSSRSVETDARKPEPGPLTPAAALNWKLVASPENAWLLDTRRDANGEFEAVFATDSLSSLTLHFADDLQGASLDGKPLTVSRLDDGMGVTLPSLSAGEHRLRYRTARDLQRSWVWLKGPFSLASRTAYEPGPSATVRTAGPFVASQKALRADAELVAGGAPFLNQPIVAEATFTLAQPTSHLRFEGQLADAMRVTLDGKPAGWVWAPEWTIATTSPLAAGEHRLRVELIPSTFNHFGPHHYCGGDWHVVSPGQFDGGKNFADDPNSPNNTLIAPWHFKPLRLPTKIGG